MLLKKLEKSVSENDIEKKRKEFIDKGGEVSTDKKKEWAFINLRIRQDMMNQIDDIIKNHRVGMNRTSWILESIQEKLNK